MNKYIVKILVLHDCSTNYKNLRRFDFYLKISLIFAANSGIC